MTTSVLLVLECHNIDICQMMCAYKLLKCLKLAWGKFKLLESLSVISRLRTQFAQTNSTLDWHRSRHPRSTLQDRDRFLHTSALRSQSVSGEQLHDWLSGTGTKVSVQIVHNWLHRAGLRARGPYVGVPLSQRHRQASLALTWQHHRWTTNNGWLYSLLMSHSFCWICLTEYVAFGVAEVRGTRTVPLLNMIGMKEEV